MKNDDSRPLTRNLAPFGVRMPPDLKERVEAAAKSNNRSINAEIVATLEEKYPGSRLSVEEIIQDLLALTGVMSIMTQKSRELAITNKAKQLAARGSDASLTLSSDVLTLEMAEGAIKFEMGLQPAHKSYAEEWEDDPNS